MRILELLFPQMCVNCGDIIENGKEGSVLCPSCKQSFYKELSRLCPRCGKEYSLCSCKPDNFLPDAFGYAMPYGEGDAVSRKMLLLCKSKRCRALFALIASLMDETAKKRHFYLDEQIITFVPRSADKFSKTGVDQAEELARALSKCSGRQCEKIFTHKSLSREQKRLNKGQREINASCGFYISADTARIIDKNIILVDDIVTTGSTVNACTRLLYEAGAKSVICLSAAKHLEAILYEMREKSYAEENRN